MNIIGVIKVILAFEIVKGRNHTLTHEKIERVAHKVNERVGHLPTITPVEVIISAVNEALYSEGVIL